MYLISCYQRQQKTADLDYRMGLISCEEREAIYEEDEPDYDEEHDRDNYWNDAGENDD